MSDRDLDTQALTWSTGAILLVYLLAVAVHNGVYHQLLSSPGPNPTLARVLSNLSATVLMLVLVRLLRISAERGWGRAAPGLVLAAGAAAAVRGFVLQLFEPYKDQAFGPMVADLSLGLLVLTGAGVLGFSYALGKRRFHAEERLASDERLQREIALISLGNEEVRVRRSVAEGLHGGLQQRLVLQVVRLDRAIARARERGAAVDELTPLKELRADLDEIREQDVRQMSRLLYPDGIEVGVVAAIRMLLRRLPTGIGTRLEVSAEFRELDDPALGQIVESERLVLVRIVEEAITYALRHGHATGLEVWLGAVGDAVVAEVLNDGAPLEENVTDASGGMSRLAARVSLAGGELRITNVDRMQSTVDEAAVPASGMSVLVRCRLPLRGSAFVG